ncbi:MAG: TetR/AcrR family transcriptional regulator [Chloroflexi bacterium]|nr:TetR/AcrR family transcriptional regulator [Chloroflexota bacterium]
MPTSTFFNLPEEKRQRILDLAVEEFAHNDYDSASVSRIVEQAGIAKGSLYQYFDGKAGLYAYLLELLRQAKSDFLAAAGAPDPQDGLFAYLRRLFRQSVAFELEHPLLAQLGYRATYGNSPLPSGLLAGARQATQEYFEKLVREGQQRGEIRPEADPRAAAFVFTAVMDGLGRYLAGQEGAAGQVAQSGHYPVDSPAVQQAFDQVMAVCELGLATGGGK